MPVTYNFSQIVGKTLTAKSPVNIYRSIYDKGPVRKAAAGEVIGVVYSWVKSKTTGALWVQFEGPYYVKLSELTGKIDTQSLYNQGTKTAREEYEESQDKNGDLFSTIKKYGLPIAAGLALLLIIRR